MAYELDDDPVRIQRDVVWEWLSTEAYWGRWRTREQIETQLDTAWRELDTARRERDDLAAKAMGI